MTSMRNELTAISTAATAVAVVGAVVDCTVAAEAPEEASLECRVGKTETEAAMVEECRQCYHRCHCCCRRC